MVLAELLELAPNGVEESSEEGVVEYAVYGAPGELPALPSLEAAAGGALVEIVTEEISDDWFDGWKQFHEPVLVGDRLRVRPPWTDALGAAGVEEIVIDPGQAFGTGSHATTRMCLELLLELEPAWLLRRSRVRLGSAGDRRRQARLVAGAGGRLRGGERGRGAG